MAVKTFPAHLPTGPAGASPGAGTGG